jgi:hypothetical protein
MVCEIKVECFHTERRTTGHGKHRKTVVVEMVTHEVNAPFE